MLTRTYLRLRLFAPHRACNARRWRKPEVEVYLAVERPPCPDRGWPSWEDPGSTAVDPMRPPRPRHPSLTIPAEPGNAALACVGARTRCCWQCSGGTSKVVGTAAAGLGLALAGYSGHDHAGHGAAVAPRSGRRPAWSQRSPHPPPDAATGALPTGTRPSRALRGPLRAARRRWHPRCRRPAGLAAV